MGKERYLQNVLQDVRYGVRLMSKNPGFSLFAIITLALGIGANTAIFSLVNGILLRQLPYNDPDRLVRLTEYYPGGALVIARDNFKTMDVAAALPGLQFNLSETGQQPVRVNAAMVSSELFSVLGVFPEIGRPFKAGEDTASNDSVVILSHDLWRSRFGGDRDVIGRQVIVEGQTRQVIGVMPASFHYPSQGTRLWVPLHLDPKSISDYWGQEMYMIGRLRPEAGVRSVAMARADQEIKWLVEAVVAASPFPRPATWNKDSVAVTLQQSLVGNLRGRLLILLSAVGLLLLMACANVANLLLARSDGRRKEFALRACLGAAPGRLVRQLLTESLLLALAGWVVGVLLGHQGVGLLKVLLPADTPRL
jgi:predicted permease